MAEFLREKIADVIKECHQTPGLKSFTSKPDEVTIEDDPLFLGGYSSYIVRLRAGDGSTVVAKHAPPCFRAFEATPLSQTRAELEMTGLVLFERYIPGFSPKPFYHSNKHSITLMEDLVGFKTLRSDLLAGKVSKAAIGSLAMAIAILHRSTHKDNISADEWTKLEAILNKFQPLREQLAQLFSSYRYIMKPKDDVSKQLLQIAERRVFSESKMNNVLNQFMVKYNYGQECVVHCDIQTQNTMVKGDEVKIIDHEIARLGLCSLEVAKLLGDLIMTYYWHLVSSEDVDNHRQTALEIKDCTYHLVNTYIEHMAWNNGEEREKQVAKFLGDLAEATGCLIFVVIALGSRTYLGAARIAVFEAGIRLMEQYHVADSVDKIYSILALENGHAAV